MQELRIEDFSGGITDNYIDGPPNAAQEMYDVYTDKNGKLVQRPGVNFFLPYFQLPTGNQAVHEIFEGFGNIYARSFGAIAYDAGHTAWYSIKTVNRVNEAYPIGTVNISGSRIINGELMIIGTSSSSIFRLGLPAPQSGFATPSGTGGGKNYILYIVYVYTYSAGGKDYTVISAPRVQALDDTNGYSGAAYITVNTLDPCDGSGYIKTTGDYKIGASAGNTRIHLYLTEEGSGVIPYFLAEVPYGDTSYVIDSSDTLSDTPLYTAGGEVDRDQPVGDLVTYTQINDTVWRSDGDKLYQCVPGIPEASPAGFYLDAEKEIFALNNNGRYPLVFEREKIYRVEGLIDVLGNGIHQKITISDSIGCAGRNATVQVENNVFFVNNKGVFVTDGYSVRPLSDNLKASVFKLTQADWFSDPLVQGTYDSFTKMIYWLIPSNDESFSGARTSFSLILVLDLNKPLTNTSCYYQWRYGRITSLKSVLAEAYRPYNHAIQQQPDYVGMYRNNTFILIGHLNGYVLSFDELKTNDSYWPANAASSSLTYWWDDPVVPEYVSCAMSFGSTFVKKWITKFVTVFENLTDLFLQFFIKNDLEPSFTELAPIQFEQKANTPVVRRVTKVASSKIRGHYKQIKIKKGYLILYKSDDYSTVTTAQIVGNKGTALLASTPPNWPGGVSGGYPYNVDDIRGYYLHLEDDGYVEGWLIVSNGLTTITVNDPNTTFPVGSGKKWLIKGYHKEHKMKLLGVSVPFESLGENADKAYVVGENNQNA